MSEGIYLKKILCILSSLNAGGAETFLMKVLRALPPSEYCFDFIVSEGGGCYSAEVEERGGTIYQIPKRTESPIGALYQVFRIVKSNHYKYVLKLASSPIAVLDLIASRLGGAKYLTLRSCNALSGLSWKQKCLNAVLRPIVNLVTDVKLAPSVLAAQFVFGERATRNDVHLLHNGLDLNVFRFSPEGRQQIREEFFLQDKLVIGHIGRFHKQKNHLYLLQIFSAILAKRKDAVLLLVGDGEERENIQHWVKEHGLEDSVYYTGVRFDIPQLLSAMDIFVFPSFYEGMPNTVIEAQATGLPCVISDTITNEANITGLVQYLSIEKDPEYWADVVLSINYEDRVDMTSEFVNNKYDIESVAKEFVGFVCPE